MSGQSTSPESETSPRAPSEADLRVARHICKWAYGYYRGGSSGASEAYAYWEGTAKDWPGTIAEINRWAYDIRAHVAAETAGLRALIVKKNEALREVGIFGDVLVYPKEWDYPGEGRPPSADEYDHVNLYMYVKEALALTLKDLEDCVVVKRSEWERFQTLSERARKSP